MTEDKICMRCKLVILDETNYIHIEELDRNEKIREEFFHKKCFDDRNFIKKLALRMTARANKLLNKAEEVVV